MPSFTKIAFSVQANCSNDGHELGYGHAQQLFAAALGYSTLASYQEAQSSSHEPETFGDVRHLVLDRPALVIRAHELGLPYTASVLVDAVKLAFETRLPAVKVHLTESHFEDALRAHVDDHVVNNDGQVSGQMAMTNSDGIDEIYLPFDLDYEDIPDPGDSLVIDLDGHVAMGIDTDRPYSGHKIKVKGTLAVERLGKRCLAAPACDVEHAMLDWGWDEPESIPLAEALAKELGLEVSEAEELVDVEPLTLASDDDLVDAYAFDFSAAASPAVAEKLMANYGSLQVIVGPNFFDNVSGTDS